MGAPADARVSKPWRTCYSDEPVVFSRNSGAPEAEITYPSDTNQNTTIQTSYAYTFYPNSNQVQQKTTTLPVISTAQNGSGTANSRKEYFDIYGNRTWLMDERGFIAYFAYDIPTGALVQQIDDVDTTQMTGVPTGWSTPSGGGLHLVTDYQFDAFGRKIQELGPSHTIDVGGLATTVRKATWTVYDDVNTQIRVGRGYATGTAPNYTFTLINPVSITTYDKNQNVVEQIQATRASTSGALLPTDTFAQTSYVRWTTSQYTDCCLLASTRVYFQIPASGTGSAGVNYNETDYGYDVMNRRNRVVTPAPRSPARSSNRAACRPASGSARTTPGQRQAIRRGTARPTTWSSSPGTSTTAESLAGTAT